MGSVRTHFSAADSGFVTLWKNKGSGGERTSVLLTACLSVPALSMQSSVHRSQLPTVKEEGGGSGGARLLVVMPVPWCDPDPAGIVSFGACATYDASRCRERCRRAHVAL